MMRILVIGLLLLGACSRAEPASEMMLADPPSHPQPAEAITVAPPEADTEAPLPESPAVADIQGGADQLMQPVLRCLEVARAAGELPPGRYTLTLDWDILPTGAVANSKMTGPAGLLKTSLPACFARGMDEWIFPPTTRGGPVRDFPFGPFEVK